MGGNAPSPNTVGNHARNPCQSLPLLCLPPTTALWQRSLTCIQHAGIQGYNARFRNPSLTLSKFYPAVGQPTLLPETSKSWLMLSKFWPAVSRRALLLQTVKLFTEIVKFCTSIENCLCVHCVCKCLRQQNQPNKIRPWSYPPPWENRYFLYYMGGLTPISNSYLYWSLSRLNSLVFSSLFIQSKKA